MMAKTVVEKQHYLQFVDYLLELKNNMSSEVKEEELPKPHIIEIIDDDR